MKNKLINYYNTINANEELSFRWECTLINCRIFDAIEDFLLNRLNSAANNVKELLTHYLDLVKYTESKIGLEISKTFDELIDLSLDVYNEFDKNQPVEYTITNLCYLIGTNSEQEENYTMTSRIAIILAIIKFLKIEDLIDLTNN